jgi:uncharacterized damage-inducible protein DinB
MWDHWCDDGGLRDKPSHLMFLRMRASDGQRLAELSLAIRRSTLKRLHQVPAGLENWRLLPDSMSFADIAQHLIDADQWLFRKLEVRDLDPLVGRSGLVHIQRREEFISLLKGLDQLGQDRARSLEKMTEEELSKTMFDSRFGGSVTIWWIIVRGNLDHEIHHRGPLGIYLRAAESRLGLRQ